MKSREYKFSYKIKLHNMASLSVYRTGYEQEHRAQVRGPEKRDFYYLTLVHKGRGIYSADGKRHHIEKDHAYLIYPHTTIQLWADEKTPWQNCWVGFNGTDARLLLDAAGFTPSLPVISLHSPKLVYKLIMDIYKSRGQKTYGLISMTARLYTLLAHLIENAALTDTLPLVRSGVIHVQRACEYIADNYTRRITIDEVAEFINLSRSQLYRVFMRHLSQSPHHYLTEFRMREACTLMEKKTSSIKEIAYAVGVDNPLYFSACFKRFIGQTPTEYIRANSR